MTPPPGAAVAEPPRPRPEARNLTNQVAGASAWSIGSMGGILVLRLLANIALAYLLLPEQFGIVAILRICLIGLEQLSDVGIRGSVIYHKEGEDKTFLNTAWTVQIGRGVLLWLMCCGIAVPVSNFYEMPILALLLPVAGIEAINNGLLSVGIYRSQRNLSMRLPVLLEWIGLVVNLSTTLIWAWIHPTVWALVAGPVAGGVAKTTMSHVLIKDLKLRPAWDKEAVRDILKFGKWIFLGTLIVFVAQQFDRLYLARFVPIAILGVYQVAWNFINQGTRVLTVMSNAVMTPLFAQYGRVGSDVYVEKSAQAVGRFLPFALLLCAPICLVSPALFGYVYPDAFDEAGHLGQFLAVVVWFMVLQQVPRTALLAVGASRGVASMSFFNAITTVVGCIVGFQLGSTRGLIIGNALGNVAGCFAGAWSTRQQGLAVGRRMVEFSAIFLALALAGSGAIVWLGHLQVEERLASLLVTAVVATPLGWWVWRTSVRGFLQQRRGGLQPAPAVALKDDGSAGR